MTTVAFFDCETNGVGKDAKITCASVVDGNGDVTSYHSGYGTFMSVNIGNRLLEDLKAFDRVVTFNGAAFDFQKLYQLTKNQGCKQLAKDSVDIMLQFTAEAGYFSSMDSFTKGTFQDEGMSKTNSGGWAAEAWFKGEGEAVLLYCESDVAVLRNIYNAALARGQLVRLTKAGKARPWVISTSPGPSMFVSSLACLRQWQTNKPNTSWMDDPPDLAKGLAWWD